MNSFTRLGSLIIFVLFSFFTEIASAQDMSYVSVDELTDTQIQQFLRQVETSGLTERQLEQVALARGMSADEVKKLRNRVEKLKNSTKIQRRSDSTRQRQYRQSRVLNQSLDIASEDEERQAESEAEMALDELRSKIFGASLFKNVNPQFEPSLNLATPRNYIIGAGDELLIEIYGYSEASHELTVSAEGNINVPYVGVIPVVGSSIEQATARIRSRLSSVYGGISSGNTNVNITIVNLRSIKVILTGEIVQPGTYTLPSVATVFNALYSSGGPTENGSLRTIHVIRNGETISTLDVYDFLTNGSQRNNITLQDQDVIHVPPYEQRVEMIGEVKRPALFEIRRGETFQDLLGFSGGFTEYAYQDRIEVLKNTSKERRIEDLMSSQFSQYEPQSGDKFTVTRILDRFENRVSIRGAVFRPGNYELSPGLTLSMLIKKADGVTEDAFLNLGTITRLKSDLQPEQLTFSVAGLLAGTETDILLQKEDVITISSISELQGEYTVDIEGEIRNPGSYNFAEGRTVSDLIFEAGGFTESASPLRIEISRRLTGLDASSENSKVAEVFQVNLDRNFEGQGADFQLRPFDLVVVRTAPGYETQQTVRIEGEVLYPGTYTISQKNERITDLLKRAGGTTPFAYLRGASLKREGITALRAAASRNDQIEKQQADIEKTETINTIKSNEFVPTSLSELQEKIRNDYVGVNFEKILEKPSDRQNLLLRGGDVIFIPKELQTVKVGGEVLSPVTSVYAPNKGFKYYVSQAGGFSEQALKRKSYIVYANGSARSTKSFLGIKSYPAVEPGAEIYVPKREPRERLNPQAWVGLGSAVASMAAIIVSLLK